MEIVGLEVAMHEILKTESADKVRILKIDMDTVKLPFGESSLPVITTTFQGKEYEVRSLASEGREGVLAAIAQELEKEQAKHMLEWDERKLEEIKGLEGKEIDLREVLEARELIKKLANHRRT
jgi:hypothetical protein